MLNQLTRHVYWLPPDSRTDRPVLGVVNGSNATLVVDAGNSPAHANLLLAEITRLHLPPPAFLVLTHWHWDHVFGAHTLDLPTIASLETRRIVTQMAQLDWGDRALDRRVAEGSEIDFCRTMMKAELPDRSLLVIKPPEIGFTGQIELDLGGVTCQIVHVAGDHSADSSVVYVVEDRVMFLGDCLSTDLYSGPRSYTPQEFLPLVERIFSFEANFYLEGHAPGPLSRRGLADDLSIYQMIGREIESTGANRPALLLLLQNRLGRSLDQEELEIVEYYLAGLDKIG
jgi:glyoxylase-like metal-dependent hydrolase (beta-lactamase superfamily II)